MLIEDYYNTIPPIERVMQGFQMEQWGKGIPILLKMLGQQDKMLDNQDKMLEKQDTTIHIFGKVKDDTSDMKASLSRIEIDYRYQSHTCTNSRSIELFE